MVRELDPDGCPPGLPGWRCVPAPGHTPGSLAFFRPADRVMLTGDAILTIDPNCAGDLLRGRPVLGGPPWVSTWSWAQACESVAPLALTTRLLPGRRVMLPLGRKRDSAAIQHMADLLQTGAFRPVIDRSYPLARIVEAYRYVGTGQRSATSS